MVKFALGVMLSLVQLWGSGGLPQILTPQLKTTGLIRAEKKGEVIISFTALKDYKIDRLLPITLELSPVPGVILPTTEFKPSSDDPKSKDGYYAFFLRLTPESA